jgi:hypothetical protein
VVLQETFSLDFYLLPTASGTPQKDHISSAASSVLSFSGHI